MSGTSVTLPLLDSTYRLYLRKRCLFATPGYSDTVWSDWSGPQLASDPVGIESVQEPEFTLYPNPASGTVVLKHGVEQGEVEVFDIQGRRVLTQPAAQRTLDVSRLAAGTYTVRLTTPQGVASRRLTVR